MNKGQWQPTKWEGAVIGNISVHEQVGTKETNNGTNRALWRCVCRCGREFKVDSQTLRQRQKREKEKGTVAYCCFYTCPLKAKNGEKNAEQRDV